METKLAPDECDGEPASERKAEEQRFIEKALREIEDAVLKDHGSAILPGITVDPRYLQPVDRPVNPTPADFVPEPVVTPEMIEAGSDVLEDFYLGEGAYDLREDCLSRIYRAMHAESPVELLPEAAEGQSAETTGATFRIYSGATQFGAIGGNNGANGAVDAPFTTRTKLPPTVWRSVGPVGRVVRRDARLSASWEHLAAEVDPVTVGLAVPVREGAPLLRAIGVRPGDPRRLGF